MIIVTHKNPDPDAIASVWLLRKYHPDFSEAEVKFVPAGSTYQKNKPDVEGKIVHIDTGFGRFDHHQDKERTCAARKVLDYLLSLGEINISEEEKEVLERMVEIITQDDLFEEVYWPEPESDRYSFWLTPILDGLKRGGYLDDSGLIEFGSRCLDGILQSLRLRIEAEKELAQEGIEFESPWGPAVGVESKNDEVLETAQKQGKILVVRKDPEGMIRIKAPSRSGVNLSLIYQTLKQKDPQATWFLHTSKRMLLNGSYKNPEMVPSKLSLKEVIGLIKKGGMNGS